MSNQKEKLWWEKQKNGGWKNLVNPLTQNSQIKTRFNRFLKTFYWKFREKKGISKNAYPEVKFLGFKKFIDKQQAGHCKAKINRTTRGNIVKLSINLKIYINQFYLLDKLGMDKFITNFTASGWTESDVSFNRLIHTIAHELAHAYQQTVNDFPFGKTRSSCKSTGEKDANGNPLYPQLVAEHTKLTAEIEQLITSSPEYQTFQTWWRDGKPVIEDEEEEPENEENEEEEDSDNKKCPSCNAPISAKATYCAKCAPEQEKEFDRLKLLLTVYKSPDLTTLEKNYQIVQNNPIYAIKTNQKVLDKNYNATKENLKNKESLQSDTANSNNNFWYKVAAWVGGGIILTMVVFALILVGLDKPKKPSKKP